MDDRKPIEILTCILQALYQLNAKGYYTSWLDWSGHTGGIYIKIIKGKWQKGKKEKIISESLLCTRFGNWKDSITGKDFDISEFIEMVNTLSESHPITKTKSKNYQYEKVQT
jgi:hypothetical protein